MSHISDITEVPISNLDSLDVACRSLGLELVRNVSYFKHRADAARGRKCIHKIRVPGSAFSEIGLITTEEGFALVWDRMYASPSLVARIGEEAELLTREYSAAEAVKQAQNEGFTVTGRSYNDQNELVLRVSR